MRVYNDFAILARDSSIDADDRMMSLFKIVDKFNVSLPSKSFKQIKEMKDSEVKLLSFPYVIASSWKLDRKVTKDYDAIIKIRLIDPSGTELATSINDVTFNPGNSRIKISGEIQKLGYTVDGEYTNEITFIDKSSNEELCKASIYFEIEVLEDIALES
jgi:hypothetical protein